MPFALHFFRFFAEKNEVAIRVISVCGISKQMEMASIIIGISFLKAIFYLQITCDLLSVLSQILSSCLDLTAPCSP